MRGLPIEVKGCLTKARESALLAVETYNRPGTAFRSGGFIVFMVIAWTALFHSIFHRAGTKPFYYKIKKGRYVRYEKVAGENKAWELTECVGQFYKSENPAVRRNLEFFIGLRNKVEHRNMPQLDDQIFGECQALLLNFESLLAKEFGDKYSLTESLAVSLQFSAITPEGKARAIRQLQSASYRTVSEYVKRFRSGLSADIEQSMEYSYKVFLVPKTGNHANSSDLAVEFIDVNSLDEAGKQEIEQAITLLKTRETEVANPGKMKPGDVAQKVQDLLGISFSTNDHTRCWKHFSVRPPTTSDDPTHCKVQYCHYDVPHKDYVYTEEWVKLLTKTLSDENKYKEILGKTTESLSKSAV